MVEIYDSIYLLEELNSGLISKIKICKVKLKLEYKSGYDYHNKSKVANTEFVNANTELLGKHDDIEYISEDSPLAKAIIGKNVGEQVCAIIPNCSFMKYTIVGILGVEQQTKKTEVNNIKKKTDHDIQLNCCCCGNIFIFSAGEQDYYREKGFRTPKRCKHCRENNYSKPILKQSSYFENAKVYGAGVNVEGGISIQRLYYAKSPSKGFLMRGVNGYIFTREITKESLASLDRTKVENFCETYNKKHGTDLEVYSVARYVRTRV